MILLQVTVVPQPFKIDDIESPQFLAEILPELQGSGTAGSITLQGNSYESRGNPYQEGVFVRTLDTTYHFAPVCRVHFESTRDILLLRILIMAPHLSFTTCSLTR